VEVKIKFINECGIKKTPLYATEGSAGMDFFSSEDYQLEPNSITLVKTNISMEIPTGYELQIRSRSGLAIKNGVFVLNAPGTIDSDYRGEICVILCNLGKDLYRISKSDRIAQGVIAKHEKASIVVSDDINNTARSTNGFGSTGLK